MNVDPATQGRILVVDDEPALRQAFVRILTGAGFHAHGVGDGREAAAALETDGYDAILSDITMPGMDGIQLLRAVRKRDLDVPVLLVTANPTVETAVLAVEFGALRYLIKPVEKETLVEAISSAVKLYQLARVKREAAAYLGQVERQVGDRAGLEASVERALASLWMAYQPIVDFRRRHVVAYEALLRTSEPTLPNPDALLSAAERLGRLNDIGRAVRASVAATLADHPEIESMFINLHPRDILDETLYAADAPLAPYAERVVLEITERAAMDDIGNIPVRIGRLRELGYRVAIDDLGAGYAGLHYFAQLTPDVVKLDISLVRNVHLEAIKRKLIGSLTTLCRDLGMIVVAEGVETAAERDVVMELGCDLCQGYLFARPGRPFPAVAW